MKSITVKNYEKLFSAAIKKGKDGFDQAIDIYLWIRDHIKEVHRHDPDHRQEEAAAIIQQVWNFEPAAYLHAARRLGGGNDVGSIKKGREIIKRFGIAETFRASRILGVDQADKLILRLSKKKKAGPKEFRKMVDDIEAKELASIEAKQKKAAPKKGINYKSEYECLLKKYSALEQKKKDLEKQLRWIKSQIKITAK